MPSSYRIRYLLSAPVIVVVGLIGIFWGGRAVAFGNRAHRWADSLDKGSGPVRLDIPFIPIFVSGARVGSLDTVVVQRHRRGAVDSLRIVVKPLASANAAHLAACAYHLESPDKFDPSDYPRALTCAADTAGLQRFGRVAFGGGFDAPLFVDADQMSCEEMLDVPEPALAPVALPARGAREVASSAAPSIAKSTAKAVKGSAEATTICTKGVVIRTQSRSRQQAVTRAEIQRIVRQATQQARQGQAEARRAVEQGRPAAEVAKHQPHQP